MPGINEKLLNNVELLVPPPSKQAKIIRALRQMTEVEEALVHSYTATANLVLALANQITVSCIGREP